MRDAAAGHDLGSSTCSQCPSPGWTLHSSGAFADGARDDRGGYKGRSGCASIGNRPRQRARGRKAAGHGRSEACIKSGGQGQKTVPKAKQPAAKKSVAPKPKATSKKKTVASKQVDKGSSATDTKALRDKKHQQQLLSLGVPKRLLSKRDQGCGKCRHRRWCTAAAGSSVASCSFNLF